MRHLLLALLVTVPLACASSGGQTSSAEPIPSDDWCALATSPELVWQQTESLLEIEGLFDDETARQMRDAVAKYYLAYGRCR